MGVTIARETEKYWDLIKVFLSLLIVLICTISVSAQVIRGHISDIDNGRHIPDVFISLADSTFSIVTDAAGDFAIEGLSPGRYVIQFQHIQFQPVQREVLLYMAKESVLDIEMEVRTIVLPEVFVPSSTFTLSNPLYQITSEEIQHYPGTFFDPARFAASFPGVQIVNDQANQLVINGLSPDLMQWHLEGLEIVNPNHLANAGTLSDRPTATGGGVNMLSNQVLSNSSLLTGATPGYGNATSGIMDMYFRDGNTNEREHTIQVGFLGIEGATEGAFKKGGRSSYLIHGSYSTLGLLGALGVDLGDEKIQFGDVSFNTQFYLGDGGGKLKVFGLFGANSNRFEAKDSVDWKEDKDRYNIDYSSGTQVFGASYSQLIGKNGLFILRSVYSGSQYERTQNVGQTSQLFSAERGTQNKLSSEIKYTGILANKSRYSFSLFHTATSHSFDKNDLYNPFNQYRDITTNIFRPYFNIKTSFTQNFHVKIGLGISNYALTNAWNLEPEAEIQYQFNEEQNITLQYRLSSQYLYNPIVVTTNYYRNSEPLRSHNVQLVYQVSLREGIIDAGVHYSFLFDVPNSANYAYSPLNLNLENPLGAFGNKGKGESLSLHIGYRRNFSNSYFISGNASFISSTYREPPYRGVEGSKRSTTYDVGYSIYISAGKEWKKRKDYGLRTWGINGGFTIHGGLKTSEIDLEKSQKMGRTVYNLYTQGDVVLGDYYRLDARIYWRKDKEKRSSTISLDIQNVTNHENDWFEYYDALYDEVRPQTQLGLIPVLSWRLDF